MSITVLNTFLHFSLGKDLKRQFHHWKFIQVEADRTNCFRSPLISETPISIKEYRTRKMTEYIYCYLNTKILPGIIIIIIIIIIVIEIRNKTREQRQINSSQNIIAVFVS